MFSNLSHSPVWQPIQNHGLFLNAIAAFVLLAFSSEKARAEGPVPLLSIDLKLNIPKQFVPQWVEFLPTGKHLAIRYAESFQADADVLAVFDAVSGARIASANIKGGADFRVGRSGRCGVSPRGDWVFYVSEGIPTFLAIPPARLPNIATTPENPLRKFVPPLLVEQIAISQDGMTAYSATNSDLMEQYFAYKWELLKPAPTKPLFISNVRTVDNEITALTMNTLSGLVAASIRAIEKPDKSVIELWTLEDKPKKTTLKQHRGATSLTFSKEGRYLAATYDDGTVAWWDLKTEKLIVHTGTISPFTMLTAAIHPSGKYLVCGAIGQGLKNLFLVEWTTGRVIAEFAGDPRSVNLVCFDSTGGKLATFGGSGVVKVWNVNDLLKSR